ncbi:MAG TPA: thiamine phosphate synthase [Gemmatimonadaceae bacterium]|nr:thiamine phosphate synthase [Gemmatimonadaceae bacterium]
MEFDPRSLLLMAITDGAREGTEALVARAAAAVRGGATMVQLRLKDADARTLVEVARALVRALPVPVLVNDRADVALAADAAGVHVGTDDLPVSAVRAIAPRGFIIGASVGADAEVPGSRGADYVGIGPVFSTLSKSDAGSAIGLEGFARLARACALPAVAIGGITEANARQVIDAGASGVALIRALLGAPDPEQAARRIRDAIGR